MNTTTQPVEKIVKPVVNQQFSSPASKPEIKSNAEPQVATPVEEVKQDKPVDPTQKTAEVDATTLIPQDHYMTSPLFYEIANYFGIEAKGYGDAVDHLSAIVDWAIEQTKSNKIQDLLPVIRELEDSIMKPTWGETRHAVVYRYIRLLAKKQSIDKDFDKMLGVYKIDVYKREKEGNGN